MNLTPLFTGLLAVLLGEELHGYHAMGGGLVLFDIAVVQGLAPMPRRLPMGSGDPIPEPIPR